MNPGSDEAVRNGCTCPVIDNGRGRGIRTVGAGGEIEVIFWMSERCPLHGADAPAGSPTRYEP